MKINYTKFSLRSLTVNRRYNSDFTEKQQKSLWCKLKSQTGEKIS